MKRNGLVQPISLIQGILGTLEDFEYSYASHGLLIAGIIFKPYVYCIILFQNIFWLRSISASCQNISKSAF